MRLVRLAASGVARACRSAVRGVAAFLSRPPLGYGKQPEQAFTRSAHRYLVRWRTWVATALATVGLILLGLIAALAGWPSNALASATTWAVGGWFALLTLAPFVYLLRPRPPLEAFAAEVEA